MIDKPNFFLFTGGPGVGKTTLLRHFQNSGEQVVEETHRGMISEQIASGGRAVPWDDLSAYCELCLRRDIAKFDALAQMTGRIFFDRGVIDSLDPRWPAPPDLVEAARSRRYNRQVFVFPPWRDIYGVDDERRQTWDEAEATFDRVMDGLARFDYDPILVPRGSIAQRADFVMSAALRAMAGPQ